jgi:outer membrane protein assembly factor BamD (BamD/ComL family)
MTSQPAAEPSRHVSTFDPELFWALHKQKIILGAILVMAILLGGGAFLGFQVVQGQKSAAAYADADSVDAWRTLIKQYPGSNAAGNAYLRIAAQLKTDGKYSDSDAAYDAFVREYPAHPLVAGGYMGLASNAELEKDLPKALKYYKQITDQFGTSYEAPMALFHQGRLTEAEAKGQAKESSLGNLQQARTLFETVVNRYPGSIAAELAGPEASRLVEKTAPAPSASASPAPSPSAAPPLQQ